MEEKNSNNFDEIISLAEASKITSYNQDYLGQLCRSGKLQGQKFGRNWSTTRGAIQNLLSQHEAEKKIEESVRAQEQESVAHAEPVAKKEKMPVAQEQSAHPHGVIGLPIVLTHKPKHALGSVSEVKERMRRIHSVERSQLLDRQLKQVTAEKNVLRNRTTAAFVSALCMLFFFSSIGMLLAHGPLKNFFGTTNDQFVIISRKNSNNVAYRFSAPGQQPRSVLGTTIVLPVTSQGRSLVANFDQDILDRLILNNLSHAIDAGWIAKPGSTVSSGQSSSTNQPGQSIAPIYYIQPSSPSASGASLFSATDLSAERFITKNATVTSQLSVSGETVLSGPVTLSGAASIGSSLTVTGDAVFSGDVSITGGLDVSGDTTTIGQLVSTRVPTLAHVFGAWPSGTSNAADATIYINPATAAADTNIFAAAVGGTVKFLVDAEGDVYANNLILSGSTSTGATDVAGNLSVQDNTSLGDATTDVLRVSGKASINLAAPTALSGDLDIRQITNGDVLLYARRATDSSPSGNFITYQNAAGSNSLFQVTNVGGILGSSLGIGTTSLDASAVVQFDSTSKGLLPPRLTTAQKNAILSPATGLTIFDTDLAKLNVYNGSLWKNVGSAEIGGEITSGTQGSVLFVGSSSTIAQDNSNFFWDDATNRLGIGTTSPASVLDIAGGISVTGNLDFYSAGVNHNVISYHGSSDPGLLFKADDVYGMKLTSAALQLGSVHALAWSNGNPYSATLDTYLQRSSAGNIAVANGGTTYWTIGSGGIEAGVDNIHDIGASGAARPRTGYFGTSVVTPTLSASTSVTTPTLYISGTTASDYLLRKGSAANLLVRSGNDGGFSNIGLGGFTTSSDARFGGLQSDGSSGTAVIMARANNAAQGVLAIYGSGGHPQLNFTGTVNAENGWDIFLTRASAAKLQLGDVDAANPVAQTLSVQNVSSGTSNTAGSNFTIAGSQSTGTGVGGKIVFQTSPAGSSGSTQNALATTMLLGPAAVVNGSSKGYISLGDNVGSDGNTVTLGHVNNSGSAGLVISSSASTFGNLGFLSASTIDLGNTFGAHYLYMNWGSGTNNVTRMASGGSFGFSSSSNNVQDNGLDTILTRRAAANWNLGAVDSASPVAQTLSVQSVVAGTTNTAGSNFTIAGSQSTGSASGGSILFQTSPAGSAGSSVNALATAMTISGNGNVGIGTTIPGARLHVNTSAAGEGAILGNAFVGVWPNGTSYAMFGNNAISNKTLNYGFIQHSNGDTWFNGASTIHFNLNAQEYMNMYSDRFESPNNLSLGSSSVKWNNLYLSGTAYAATGVGIGTTTAGAMLHIVSDNATTNDVTDLQILQHTTTGTAAAGIGASQLFRTENASGTLKDVARIQSALSVATAGSETSTIEMKLLSTPLSSSLSTALKLDGNTYAVAVGLSASANGSLAIALGRGASAGGTSGFAVGFNASAAGNNTLALGTGSSVVSSSDNSFAIGQNSSIGASSSDSIAIGQSAVATGTGAIALGAFSSSTSSNQMVIGGGSSRHISSVYIGNGVTSTAPVSFILQGTGGSGTNIAGASVTLAGGKATGNAAGGDILFQTSDAGSTGTTLQSLTTKLIVKASGNVGVGTTTPGAKLEVAPAATTSGSRVYLKVSTAADTNMTASTESIAIDFNTAATRQFAAGALANQREVVFRAPTYAFTSASTITMASTVSITGPPVAGTNATITKGAALQIENGNIYLGNTSANQSAGILANGQAGWPDQLMFNLGSIDINLYNLSNAYRISSDGLHIAPSIGILSSASGTPFAQDVGFQRDGAAGWQINNATAGQWGYLKVGTRDAGTNIVTNGLTIGHQSTGTPAAGLGSAILFNINSSTTADQNAAQIAALWTTATHASRTSALTFSTVNNAAALAEVMRIQGDGNVGIGTTTPGFQLEVVRGSAGVVARFTDSDGSCDIDPTSTALVCASDQNLKKDISTLQGTLAKLQNFRGVNFRWKTQDDSALRIGFIAQEVESVYPELVKTDPQTGIKSVNYIGFAPVLVNAIKEQQDEITALQNQIASIQGSDATVSSNTPITFKSHLYLSKDSVGQAKVLAGSMSVRITFEKEYEWQPIVTVTPNGKVGSEYWIADKDATGFTIYIEHAASTDIIFDWHSFAGEGAKLTLSSGPEEDIVLVIPGSPAVPTENNGQVVIPETVNPVLENQSNVDEAVTLPTESENTSIILDPK